MLCSLIARECPQTYFVSLGRRGHAEGLGDRNGSEHSPCLAIYTTAGTTPALGVDVLIAVT